MKHLVLSLVFVSLCIPASAVAQGVLGSNGEMSDLHVHAQADTSGKCVVNGQPCQMQAGSTDVCQQALFIAPSGGSCVGYKGTTPCITQQDYDAKCGKPGDLMCTQDADCVAQLKMLMGFVPANEKGKYANVSTQCVKKHCAALEAAFPPL